MNAQVVREKLATKKFQSQEYRIDYEQQFPALRRLDLSKEICMPEKYEN